VVGDALGVESSGLRHELLGAECDQFAVRGGLWCFQKRIACGDRPRGNRRYGRGSDGRGRGSFEEPIVMPASIGAIMAEKDASLN